MIHEIILLCLSGALIAFLQVSGTHSFPRPLSAEEEKSLFHAMRDGSADARNTLICRNLRLVSHIIRKYYPTAQNQDDLVSIGTVGLIKAVDTFDPDKGAHFATYASRCIQNEILMHFRAQKKILCEVSINDTIDMDHDGNPLTYVDIIKVDDTIADDIDEKWKIARALRYIKDELNERERQIITLRYGLGNRPSVTQREVAQKLGISRSYVSRIEKNVLARLSAYLEQGSGE